MTQVYLQQVFDHQINQYLIPPNPQAKLLDTLFLKDKNYFILVWGW